MLVIVVVVEVVLIAVAVVAVEDATLMIKWRNFQPPPNVE